MDSELTMHARLRLAEAGIPQGAAFDTSIEEDSAAIRARQESLGARMPGARIYEPNRPAFNDYPLSRERITTTIGANGNRQLGMNARSVMVTNPSPYYIYLSAFDTYIPPFSRSMFNVAGGAQSFDWAFLYAPFDPTPPVAYAGWVTFELHEEWLPPFSETMPPATFEVAFNAVVVGTAAAPNTIYTPPPAGGWAILGWEFIADTSDFYSFGWGTPGTLAYRTSRGAGAGYLREVAPPTFSIVFPRSMPAGSTLTFWNAGGIGAADGTVQIVRF